MPRDQSTSRSKHGARCSGSVQGFPCRFWLLHMYIYIYITIHIYSCIYIYTHILYDILWCEMVFCVVIPMCFAAFCLLLFIGWGCIFNFIYIYSHIRLSFKRARGANSFVMLWLKYCKGIVCYQPSASKCHIRPWDWMFPPWQSWQESWE